MGLGIICMLLMTGGLPIRMTRDDQSIDSPADIRRSQTTVRIRQGASGSYQSNTTLAQGIDDDINSIAIGDADNDGDNDIVAGTAPHGLVIVFENIGGSTSVQFNATVIANYSIIYGVFPVIVTDVAIADLEGSGSNSILAGTSYYITDHVSRVGPRPAGGSLYWAFP